MALPDYTIAEARKLPCKALQGMAAADTGLRQTTSSHTATCTSGAVLMSMQAVSMLAAVNQMQYASRTNHQPKHPACCASTTEPDMAMHNESAVRHIQQH